MLEEILNEYGFSVSVRKAHATEFKNDEIVIYTVPGDMLNLIVSPEDYVFVSNYKCKKYHNSNLVAFPKEKNKGENKIHYGYKIEFDSSLSVKDFLGSYEKFKKT